MSRYNLFSGNKTITETIAKALGFQIDKDTHFGWFTKDMYFQSYFYLSKRFGFPIEVDDYKRVTIWEFAVKDFRITVNLDSSKVIFMIFGKYQESAIVKNTPYNVKFWREISKKIAEYLPFHKEEGWSDFQINKYRELLSDFRQENKIPKEVSEKEIWDKYGIAFYEKLIEYNNNLVGVSYEDYEKYGDYMNSYRRRALRTLEQFLHNMLTPIWIRDVPLNIKGFMTDSEAFYYTKRYDNNIAIKLINEV
ncbi:hypothetical protein PG616_12960 [Riemerella anatipestifer]|nr:hypothetical protein [Riemerella anatipestifer]